MSGVSTPMTTSTPSEWIGGVGGVGTPRLWSTHDAATDHIVTPPRP